MIPKVIHYCWFGKNPLPESAIKCMDSWKKYCPDFEIKRWDETNFDIFICAYTKEAYEKKKYAFVSDYARFWILNQEGGIYMDTDVEVLKSITPLLNKSFMGFETNNILNPGLTMGTNKNDPVCTDMLNSYEQETTFEEKFTVCDRITKYFIDLGLEIKNPSASIEFCGYTLYPPEYFNPLGENFDKLTITPNTYSIHHYDASWKSPDEKLLMKYRVRYGRKKGTLLFCVCHPFKALIKAVKRV